MFDNIKVDLNQVSSYIWIAIIATIFSIFSIKYNATFIHFGFVTFAYGIIGHVVFKTFDSIDFKKESNKKFIRIILEATTIGAWIYFILN